MSDILQKTKKRKYYYKIYFLIRELNRWVKSVYRPLHPTDRQSLLVFAQSVINSTTNIQNQAKELISLLEEDDVSENQKITS